ncbi:MAG: hypothetical protein D6690_02590 [Nitrospirae bacterium]|nr:MAG: hypothetical protein D6690_02590 [Nitrospirota bacterium]
MERFGHEALDVRDVGLRSAKDSAIAQYAQVHRTCLLTGDFGFADIRNYPPENYFALLYSFCRTMLLHRLFFICWRKSSARMK